MAVFTEALGTYAQRLATIAHGDSACTTFIPAAAVRCRARGGRMRRPRPLAPSTGMSRCTSDGRTTS